MELKLASCMAENGEPFCQNVVAYIHTQLGIARWGRSILSGSQRVRFVSASDADHDPIRNMTRPAEQIALEAFDLIKRFFCGTTMLIF
jgi:hypothetical protein